MFVKSVLIASAVESNQSAYERMERVLFDSTLPVDEKWDRYVRAVDAVTRSLEATFDVVEVGTTVYSADGELIVASIKGDEIILTSDGLPASLGWHRGEDGPMSVGQVRYERFLSGTQQSHGYLDPISRKIVQTG